MAEYDKASRYLAKQDPPGFFAWLWRYAVTPLVFTRWLDARRLARPAEGDLTCDTVASFRLADQAEETHALVVEIEAHGRADSLEQILSYVIRLRTEAPPPGGEIVPPNVGGVLINLTGAPQPRLVTVSFPGLPDCDWRFGVLLRPLREEDAAATLADIAAGRTTRWLLPWIPLMHGGAEPAIMEEWKQTAQAEPDERARATMAAFALLFAELAKCYDPWKRALEDWNVQKSQVVEEWRNEARRDDLLRLLRKRFGVLPQDLVERVHATADAERLQAALEQVLDIHSLDELQL